MKLIIVESPKKCDTIGRYLGKEYKVMASQGHIRDLSKKGKGGFGIDIDNDFQPDFLIDKKKAWLVDELRKTASKADEVILATDPDREGEAISWHLAEVLDLDVESTKRLQFHEITKPAIEEAIKNPGHIDMNLVNSQETRRMLDRILGFKLSNLLQRKMTLKSAGRVQSATLKLICDNDDEIAKFVPEEYWTIDLNLNIDGKIVKASLDKVDGKDFKIHNKEEADAILARIPKTLPVTSLETTKKKVPSKLPFTTSTMQQEAFAKFHFSTKKTQDLAQSLYEGLDVNGEHVGLITYMRTDSVRISDEFFYKHAKPFIEKNFGSEYVGYIKAGKKKERIQDAHEAIRPTGTSRTPEIVARFVSADEAKLYRLIYDRAIGSLMSDKVDEVTTVLFEANGLTFRATGNRTLFKGYEAIYGEFDDDETKLLPEIAANGVYAIKKIDQQQKYTKAPARFTEAKVVKTMEEVGIGRPSTYAATIQRLKEVGYISIKGGTVTPTEDGKRVTFVLNKYFPELISTEYTANMEGQLDQISEGETTRKEAMTDFYYPFITKFESVQAYMWKDHEKETGEMCPECGSPLVIKKGRFGEFIACSRYPECNFKPKKPVVEAEQTGELCPQCGKPLVVRKNAKGDKFVACSGYPACKYIKDNEAKEKKEVVVYTEADYLKQCPDCRTGHLVYKMGKKAKYIGCTNFPKCRHVEWINKLEKKGRRGNR
ncbi:MAG: type I DNA topoisomerase [Bacilli bacterium]|nr:type I DNA topoisomerase [Bacilli bacterium]